MHVYPRDGIAEELRFQWQTFEMVEGETAPRFFTPVDDDDEPLTAFFDTVKQAEDYRNNLLENLQYGDGTPEWLQNWVLVEVKLRAVKWYKDT